MFYLTLTIGFGQQTFSIKGKITDTDGITIEFGEVLLLKKEQANPVRYVPIEQGFFTLGDLPRGNYSLRINCAGFKEISTEVYLDDNKSVEYQLTQSVNQLDEVTMVATKNPISYKNGTVEVDVQNPVFSAIPDALGVLARIPNVQLSPARDNITVIGKGSPLIYLDNQLVDFEVLSTLNVANLSSVELIMNPSSKYEASGRAVLVLKSKRNTKRGINGSLQETASFKRNYNNYLAANTNFGNGKLEVRASANLNHLQTWESNGFLFEIPRAQITSDYLVLVPKNKRIQRNYGLGVYLPLNGDSYLSVNSVGKFQADEFDIETASFLAIGEESSTIYTLTDNDNSNDYITSNLNFNRSFDDKWEVFLGAQHSYFDRKLGTEIANGITTEDYNLEQTRDQKFTLNTWALRMDVAYDIKTDAKWEWGASSSQARANAFSLIENLSDIENTIIDFAYTEQLYAAYTNLSLQLLKNWKLDSGLRMEHNEVKSELETIETPLVERKKTRFFPKFAMHFNFKNGISLSSSYAKSIARPNYARTSSIAAFINPVLEGTGNINLQPSITDEVSMNVQHKDKSLRFGFYKTNNPFNFTISYDDSLGVAALSQVNLDKEQGYYISALLPFSKGIWTSNNTISLNRNKISDDTGVEGRTTPFLYLYSQHQFKITKDTTLAFSAWAMTKRNEGLFQRNALYSGELTFAQKIGQSLMITLRINDIFRQLEFEDSYQIAGVRASGTYFSDGRELACSIKYNWGQKRDAKFKNKDVDENLNRIN